MNSLHIYIYKNQEGAKRIGQLIEEVMSGNECIQSFDGYQNLLNYKDLSISYSDFYVRFFAVDDKYNVDFSLLIEKIISSLNAESIMYSTFDGKDRHLKLKNYKPNIFVKIRHAFNEFLKY